MSTLRQIADLARVMVPMYCLFGLFAALALGADPWQTLKGLGAVCGGIVGGVLIAPYYARLVDGLRWLFETLRKP